ncbi:MAG: helix-turn-helix domain-containing protein [Phycisphaerae bacterium]
MEDFIALIKERGRADIADRLGCSRAYVSQIAHGFRKPSPKLAIRIESEFGIDRSKSRPDIYQARQETA